MTQCNHLYISDIYKNMTMNINAFTLIMRVVFDLFRPNNLFIIHFPYNKTLLLYINLHIVYLLICFPLDMNQRYHLYANWRKRHIYALLANNHFQRFTEQFF